jgi:hypothetical protein
LQQGEAPPPRGWYSPAFGDRQPTRRLCFAGLLAPGVAAVTLFDLADG